MKRRLLLIPFLILAIFLDCFVFPSLFGSGMRPLFVLSLALAATFATKVQDGIVVAILGGLITDLFVNPYVGLSAAAYLIAVCIAYGFTKKHERARLRALFGSLVSAVAAETVIFVFSLLIGARFDAYRLLTATLPSVILETLCVLPLRAALRAKEKDGSIHR